jgi:molybdopterin-guanine dinucleotide biosynthesis protein A
VSAHEGRIANVTGAVLVGGASSRIGSDKAHLPIGGVPGAVRVARLLDGLFAEVLLVGGDPPAEAAGRRVPDGPGPVAALRGLVAALAASTTPWLFVAATDLPLLTPDLVLAIVAWPEADAVVPRTQRGPHPLCSLYRVEAVLPVARRKLAQGSLALHRLLDELATAWLEPQDLALVDPAATALTNVNTREELARLERRVAAD